MSKRIKLKIASPCDADWEAMSGDEAKRFCGACKQDVYQLSNMSTEEVESLLKQRTGLRTCGRFYKRADGSVMTSDCSVGVSQKRKRRVLKVVGAAAFSVSAVGLGYALAPDSSDKQSSDKQNSDIVDIAEQPEMGKIAIEPTESPPTKVQPEPELPVMGRIAPVEEPELIMGDVAYEEEVEPELVKGEIRAVQVDENSD